ncbi:hypothetical protein [Deinococcus sp. LM3]|nr:hypothetical protein [Deinococcus sp. LM3]
MDLLLLGWFTVDLWRRGTRGPAFLMGLTCLGWVWLLSDQLALILGW